MSVHPPLLFRGKPIRKAEKLSDLYITSTPTNITMVKPLTFKGDKKSKKRKRTVDTDEKFGNADASAGDSLVLTKAEGDPDSKAEDDDSWVTAEAVGDLVGPVVFVLPSEPPTCIACDSNGKVFAS